MTQHDAEVLAQFASTWFRVNDNESLRAVLACDLADYCRGHCLEFDAVAYWLAYERAM